MNILKPDDVLKEGDVVHWYDGTTERVGFDGRWKASIYKGYDFIERPDPVMPDSQFTDKEWESAHLEIEAQFRERVRILREALEFYADNNNYNDRHGKTMAVDTDDGDKARAALEATK